MVSNVAGWHTCMALQVEEEFVKDAGGDLAEEWSPWSRAWHCPEAASHSLIRPSLPASADTITWPEHARAHTLLAQPSRYLCTPLPPAHDFGRWGAPDIEFLQLCDVLVCELREQSNQASDICDCMHFVEGLVEDKKQGSRSDGEDSSMQTWEASAMAGAQ